MSSSITSTVIVTLCPKYQKSDAVIVTIPGFIAVILPVFLSTFAIFELLDTQRSASPLIIIGVNVSPTLKTLYDVEISNLDFDGLFTTVTVTVALLPFAS